MKLKLPLITILVFIALSLTTSSLNAQLFSGSDISNYRCVGIQGAIPVSRFGSNLSEDEPHIPYEKDGKFLCAYKRTQANGNSGELFEANAIPKPPPLTIIQVWFVRIIAIMWGVSGVAFTGLLVWIGFKYMTSFNNEYQLGKVIEDLRKWMVGLGLVFLSYPFLVTFFRVLPLSQTSCYDEINVPGFQFFFPEACETDPCLSIFDNFEDDNSTEANRAYQACLDNQ